MREKEKELNYELECTKLEKVKEQLQDQNVISYFLALTDYRVVKFKGIFQCVLYFLGHRKEAINIPKTNILDWKKCARMFNESLINKLLSYSHRGSKHERIHPYAKVNRLAKMVEKFEISQVENYNLGLGRVLRFMQLTLKLRKLDIEIRKMKVENHK